MRSRSIRPALAALVLCWLSAAACSVKSNPDYLDCANLPKGVLGAPYQFDLDNITDDDAAFGEWTATNLPLGLSLDPDTGVISGVPLAGLPEDEQITFSVIVDDRPFDFVACSDPFGCMSLPIAAVGVQYSVELASQLGMNAPILADWSALELPTGLTLDPDTGVLSGLPEVPSDGEEIAIEVTSGETTLTFCAEFRALEQPLSALGIRDQDMHCLPHTTTKAEILEVLEGGDGGPITCHAPAQNIPEEGFASCVLGDGNGKIAPGLEFDETSCAHLGEVDTDIHGTWVWTIEVEQEGFSTWVPFCATNEAETFHDIELEADGAARSELEPIFHEFDPDEALVFPAGFEWTIQDPSCDADPSACDNFGLRSRVQCSPFDAPFSDDAEQTGLGFTHTMIAGGPAPSPSFHARPFVTAFDFTYCTSADPDICDPTSDDFDDDAQTNYHLALIAYPLPSD